jgi:hypothetical protein
MAGCCLQNGGAVALAKALGQNRTLALLDLRQNNLGLPGARALSTLVMNRC